MAVFIGPWDTEEYELQPGTTILARRSDTGACVYLDPQTGCTIYERRPNMCRGFPYGGACPICTYDDRRPDVPGTLREEFLDPERLRAFVNRQRAR